MSKPSPAPAIRLRGVRHNNLKNFDLDLPLHKLIVITGLSGSGKSSLAFDTLFAEGQRRYIETFSPYARQFFDRMDKPQVDSIEGIPPAIAIEQRNAVKTTRSTVGTMTEICDYMKVLWPQIAKLHCRQCGQMVRKEPPHLVWESVKAKVESGIQNAEFLITFDLPLSEKLSLAESFTLIAKQGYQRLMLDGKIIRLDEFPQSVTANRQPAMSSITVVQDRLHLTPNNRARFIEACEQAYHFGKGTLAVRLIPGRDSTAADLTNTRFNVQILQFSNRLHCARCKIEYREPSPALFSFNNPVGACPTCKGFGRVISINYELAVPDRSLTLAEGAVKPWRSGTSAECQDDLRKYCRIRNVPMNVPFARLPKHQQAWVMEGDPDYGIDDSHEWPHAWYGVKGYFKWLEGKSYKMHVRVLLSRYRTYTTCPDCDGQRFQPDALLYLLPMAEYSRSSPANRDRPTSRLSLADFYGLSIECALELIRSIAEDKSSIAGRHSPLETVFDQVKARLGYLNDVGLGYLTLDRPTRTLSGGETERVNLTTCLGTHLVNTLFVLDEPSVGLHPRDTERLVRILEQLRNAGNTVVVVEHEPTVMRAADQIVDLGPGHGATGGSVVFQGGFPEILKSPFSLTGQYLSGTRQIEVPTRRLMFVPAEASPQLESVSATHRTEMNRVPTDLARLKIHGATRHNLKDLTVEIPLGRFVCLTGVSGSGKTTLAREVLFPALESRLKPKLSDANASNPPNADAAPDEALKPASSNCQTTITGHESLSSVVLVDQSPLGKTPRSNPAVYIGAFDDIRELFAQSEAAKQRGLDASAFSFNSSQGQCERCRGAGFERIEMQFLSDVFIRCPDCNGRRYRQHVLETKVESPVSRVERSGDRLSTLDSRPSAISWSIADVLDATVDEAIDFLSGFPDSKFARRGAANLQLLQEVGLGYLSLGQPINTLSGGESQRLKLVSHLAQAEVERRVSRDERSTTDRVSNSPHSTLGPRQILFIMDEPTTGLHFDDIRVLLQVFQRLVAAGHSLLVIEHNLEVVKCADWVIDLGPDAGDRGGKIVAQGTPEDISACKESYTGAFLKQLFSGN